MLPVYELFKSSQSRDVPLHCIRKMQGWVRGKLEDTLRVKEI